MAEKSVPSSKCIEEVNNGVFSESWSSTQIKVAKVTHTWTINNFSFCGEKIGEKLVSPTFSVGIDGDKSEWVLCLYPKGYQKNERNFVSLFIFPISIGMTEFVKCKLGIVNSKDQLVNILTFLHRFIIGEDWGFRKFVAQKFLFDEANEVLPNDKLTIFCEIVATVGSKNISGPLALPQSNPAMGFQFLLENIELSDVTLTTGACGKEFPAHKVILTARSPVFRAMFQSDMEESRNNRVEITDIDDEGLAEMLRFMYTGEIKKLEKLACQLLIMAEKYAMADLKNTCEKSLFKSLCFENVIEIFILSDTVHATELKVQVKEFIVTHASVVVNMPEFQSMIRTHPHLGIEACCAINGS